MNSESLLILDSALRNSLVVFLASFVFFTGYALYRLRRRKRQLADFFEEFTDQPSAQPTEHFELNPNRLQPILHSLLAAAACAIIAFLFLGFAPVPFVHNFASGTVWQKSPLRLTQIKLDRFNEGFGIEGEVWNQTEEAIDKLQVVVTIWDHEENPLDRLTVDTKPSPLSASRAGTFKVRYEENSPFLSGYALEFLDGEGVLIPHIEGFNVR